MSNKIINPFTDIAFLELPQQDSNKVAGQSFLSNLKELSIGDGSNVFRADEDGIWLGGATFDLATFKVSMGGVITASDMVLTGGTIKYGKTSFSDSVNAGYYIGNEGIYSGSASDTTLLKFNISTGAFEHKGKITAGTGSDIGATYITGSIIASQIGSVNASAITGSITAGQISSITAGQISGSIISTQIGSINATTITIGQLTDTQISDVSADKLTVGTIDASVITVTNLNAGNISTGTMSGITFKTSGNNERVELISDTIKFYVGNTLKATLDGSSAGSGGVKNTGDFYVANNRAYYITSSGGGSTEYGGISITSSNEFWLNLGTANTFFIKNNAGTANYLTVSSTKTYLNGYLLLKTFSSNPTTETGSIWHYVNGATNQFRGEPSDGWIGSFDMTAA